MTDNLGRLAAIIKARTPGRYADVVSDSYGCDWHVEGPPDSNLRIRGDVGVIAERMRCGDAEFLAVLGSIADELLAVVQHASNVHKDDREPDCDCQVCLLADALAALDARLAAVLPGGA